MSISATAYQPVAESHQTQFFGKAFRVVMRDRRLSPRARLVHAYLQDRANKDRECWPSYETIADDLGFGRRQTFNAVKELVGAGWLRMGKGRRNGKRYRHNVYTVIEPSAANPVPVSNPVPPSNLVPRQTETSFPGGNAKEIQGTRPIYKKHADVQSVSQTGISGNAETAPRDYRVMLDQTTDKGGVLVMAARHYFGDRFAKAKRVRPRLGRLARDVGAKRVLRAIAQASAERIDGDPVDYVTQIIKPIEARRERNRDAQLDAQTQQIVRQVEAGASRAALTRAKTGGAQSIAGVLAGPASGKLGQYIEDGKRAARERRAAKPPSGHSGAA